MTHEKVFRVTLPTSDVDAFLQACEEQEWYAFDTGERIMTEDGLDAESVLLVEPPARMTPAERSRKALLA